MVSDRYLARVYIQQARATRWPHWRAYLLASAKRLRTTCHHKVGQLDLFQ